MPTENRSADISDPIIDVKSFGDSEDDEDTGLRQMGKEILKAFDENGFLYLLNGGPTKNNIEDFVAAGDDFFNLDSDIKLKYTKDIFTLHGYSDDTGERIIYRRADHDVEENSKSKRENFHLQDFERIYPEEVPALKTSTKAIVDKLLPTVFKVLKALELVLELPRGHLSYNHKLMMQPGNLTCLKIMRYLPPSAFEQTIRLEDHFDFSTITFQLHGDQDGLQLLDRNGKWRESSPNPNYTLLLPGEMLEFITGDRIRPTKHRVSIPEDESKRMMPRHAVIFFAYPDDEARVAQHLPAPLNSSMTALEYAKPKLLYFYGGNPEKIE